MRDRMGPECAPEGIRLVQTGNLGIGNYKDRRDKARFINDETFERLKCFEVFPTDILISRLPDPVGRACIIPETGERMITAVDCSIVRPKAAKVDPRFLVYYTQTADYLRAVDERCTGTTRRRISRKNLGQVPIPLPPLEEQKGIVAVLDQAFSALDSARAHAEANLADAQLLFERQAAEIFQYLERRHPARRTVADVAASAKGSIRTGPFGSQLLHSEFVDNGIAVLGIDNAVANEFRWAKRRYITEKKYEQLSRYTVRPGDVVITIMGTCGKCAVIPDDIPLAINTKHLCCITLDRTKSLPDYLHRYFLLSQTARAYLSAQASGSIMDGLNMGIIKGMPISVPPITAQGDVVGKIAKIEGGTRSIARRYKEQIADLDSLRQSLLQKAFAGELIGGIRV